jgi:hypothetical protein
MDDIDHTAKVPKLGYGQKNKTSCWLASFRMILAHAGRNANSVEDLLNGADIDVNGYKAEGMPDTVYEKACTALGLQGFAGTKFNKAAGWDDWGVSDGAWAFIEELQKRPLWVSKCSGSNYHAIVAVGYRSSGDMIRWFNPWPGEANAVEDTAVYANTFMKNISNAKCSVMGKKV